MLAVGHPRPTASLGAREEPTMKRGPQSNPAALGVGLGAGIGDGLGLMLASLMAVDLPRW